MFFQEKTLFVRTPQSDSKTLKRKLLATESSPCDEDGNYSIEYSLYHVLVILEIGWATSNICVSCRLTDHMFLSVSDAASHEINVFVSLVVFNEKIYMHTYKKNPDRRLKYLD